MKMIAVLIDGGHVRVLARQAGHQFKADFLEKVGVSCADADEDHTVKPKHFRCQDRRTSFRVLTMSFANSRDGPYSRCAEAY